MTAEEIKRAQPGTELFDGLKVRAIAGDQQAARDYAMACLWNALRKNHLLSARRRASVFTRIVNSPSIEVSIG